MLYFGGGYPGLYFLSDEPFVAPPIDLAIVSIQIPMLVVTGGQTRAVVIQHSLAQPMRVLSGVALPMTQGMNEQVEVPARVHTRVTLERN